MIKTILIEDERLVADEFRRMLMKASSEMELIGSFRTVKESVEYFSTHEAPDLIFSDIQLPDGLSFDIFNKVNIRTPVIFITAYDNFLLQAFDNNGIDYLLKPIGDKALEKALHHYKSLQGHFAHQQPHLPGQKRASRLVVRKGIEHIILKREDIAIIYTENKLVYAVDRGGKKFYVDGNLGELVNQLDPEVFFRANRQFIINIGFVKSYRSFEKVKIKIDITVPGWDAPVLVSQETAPFFRRWMNGDYLA